KHTSSPAATGFAAVAQTFAKNTIRRAAAYAAVVAQTCSLLYRRFVTTLSPTLSKSSHGLDKVEDKVGDKVVLGTSSLLCSAPPPNPLHRFLRQLIKRDHGHFQVLLFGILDFVMADSVQALNEHHRRRHTR